MKSNFLTCSYDETPAVRAVAQRSDICLLSARRAYWCARPTAARPKLLILSLVLLVAGCDDGFYIRRARKAFPRAEIAAVPGRLTSFIVRETNGAIYFKAQAGEAALIFPPQ